MSLLLTYSTCNCAFFDEAEPSSSTCFCTKLTPRNHFQDRTGENRAQQSYLHADTNGYTKLLQPQGLLF